MTYLSASILLFIVMDPFGNIPFFLSILKSMPAEKRQRVIARELVIALLILCLFVFIGPGLLKALKISQSSLSISGGIILFLISIKMIFGKVEEMFGQEELSQEPLIVPLAVPAVAGPSAMATILLLVGQAPDQKLTWLAALFTAWAAISIILLLSLTLGKLIGSRGLSAIEKLMGLILTAVSVEMFIQGVKDVMQSA